MFIDTYNKNLGEKRNGAKNITTISSLLLLVSTDSALLFKGHPALN